MLALNGFLYSCKHTSNAQNYFLRLPLVLEEPGPLVEGGFGGVVELSSLVGFCLFLPWLAPDVACGGWGLGDTGLTGVATLAVGDVPEGVCGVEGVVVVLDEGVTGFGLSLFIGVCALSMGGSRPGWSLEFIACGAVP